MKPISLACLFVLFLVTANLKTNAQLYKDAIGIRLGPTSPAIQNGISYKHFLNETNAVEGIISFGDVTGLCGLYEIHKPISVENLQWFIGGGGYAAFGNTNTYIGAAGIIGLDYKFSQIPLNISLDWKPELNLVSKIGFEGAAIGFGARFTF